MYENLERVTQGNAYHMQHSTNGTVCLKVMSNHKHVTAVVNLTKGALRIQSMQSVKEEGKVYFIVIYEKVGDYTIDEEYDYL